MVNWCSIQTSESFGNVTVGSQSSQTVTLTNKHHRASTVSQAVVSGSGFSLSGISTPLALNAGANTTFTHHLCSAIDGQRERQLWRSLRMRLIPRYP